MILKYLFPSIIIALNIGAAAVYMGQGDTRRTIYWLAAAVYMGQGDTRRTIYWLAAAVLTATVTF
jgi:hypothetical protein